MTHGHRFPYDSRGETDQRPTRKVMLSSGLGDGDVLTLSGERDEPIFAPPTDASLRAFTAPISWFDHEGRTQRRLGMEETQAFIPVVERRLELNARLLVEYPEQILEQTRVVEQNQERIDAAMLRVRRVVAADRALVEEASAHWRPQGGQLLTQTMISVAPELWLASQSKVLRETPEWHRLEMLEMRGKNPSSLEMQAVRELTRLQEALKQERNNTTLLETRLADLKTNLSWWEREFAALDEPLPAPATIDPAYREHLRALKEKGQLFGDLAFP